MSDLDSLRQILALPDDDADTPEPDDQPGVRATATDDDAESEAEEPLSPEELVAEAVRQDAEEHGEATEAAAAEDAEESDDAEEVDLAELREKARLYDELQLATATAALESKQRALENEIAGRKKAARLHYAKELNRLLGNMEADAENTPNPAAYKARHRETIIASVQDAMDAWLGQIDADYEARATVLFHERNKPLFAKHLIESHNLPDDPRLVAELLKVSDINRMPERAGELARMYEQWQAMRAAADQAVREEKAKVVKQTQPHASTAASKPRRRKPVEYTGSKDELRHILALR